MSLHIEPYIVGKYYRVPVVLATVYGMAGRWPILGPLHEDAEYIDAPYDHYHVDGRFLYPAQLAWLIEHWWSASLYPPNENAVYSIVVLAENVHSSVEMKRRRCQRIYPVYPAEKIRWIPALTKAYRDTKLTDTMVCPHRGASLQGLEVKGGCVTCPLHGLKWNLKTRRLAAVRVRRAAEVGGEGKP